MSRTVPTGARSEWPYEPEGQGRNGERIVPRAGRGDRRGGAGPEYEGQAPGQPGYGGQGRGGQDGRVQQPGGYGNQGYPPQRPDPRVQGAPGAPGGQGGPRYPSQGPGGRGYGGQSSNGTTGRPRGGQAYPEQGGYDRRGYQPAAGRPGLNAGAPGGQGYGGPGYGDPRYAGAGYAGPGYAEQGYAGQDYADQPTQAFQQGYRDQAVRTRGYPEETGRRGYGPRRPGGPDGPGGPGPGRQGPGQPGRKVRFRRLRRVARLRSVRIVGALFGVFLIWVMFSVGQAITSNNGQSLSSNLAEWARDHYLGPVVTFGEWLSYSPPKTGGKPSFSLAIPKGEQATPAKTHAKGFTPDIPGTLRSLAGSALPGEGQWRVVETVKGQPAIFTTFLRDATYTSYVNGIASMDQRLVKFQLHPGSEDPGQGNWGAWGSSSIQPGSRTGLLATFNGGFKLDSAGGGFYLNGHYHGSLVKGVASIVYYKNGTIKIGEWGRDFSMDSSIEGVRQNLKLLVDHGNVAADANSNVMSNWGATLGGGYYVWRSGIGITKDGRVLFVYGPALNAKDLGQLLQRAGAVEGMQLDINPYWMKYEYYKANGHPSDPTPVNLLPTQQQSAYSYYSNYTRDFTAVYAR
ncbi:MAG TPA: phosphodiester glycosidase family protein [Trebonia sp.]